MIYIYNFEFGSIGVDTEPPTDDDMLCVNQGLLSVVKTDGEQAWELDADGEFKPASRAEVIVTCGSEFHELE